MQNRTGTPASGDSAAYLAEVRKRVTLIHDPHVEPIPVPGDDAGNARLRLAFEDVPRLLAAVEAVLALHPLTGYVWRVEPCAEHLSFDTTVTEHRDCPACAVIERDGCCARCRDEHDDPARPEDCKERQAISAALRGKSAAP